MLLNAECATELLKLTERRSTENPMRVPPSAMYKAVLDAICGRGIGLVTVGGGEDAASRLDVYLDCQALKPADWETTLALGPLLDPERALHIRRRARVLGGVSVHTFLEDLPSRLAESDAVIGMAGYNTTAEILQSGVPAVLLPRTAPRREQELRAERLSRLGLVQSLPSPTPETLRGALERALSRRRNSRCPLPLNGAQQLCAVAQELLGEVALHHESVLSA